MSVLWFIVLHKELSVIPIGLIFASDPNTDFLWNLFRNHRPLSIVSVFDVYTVEELISRSDIEMSWEVCKNNLILKRVLSNDVLWDH